MAFPVNDFGNFLFLKKSLKLAENQGRTYNDYFYSIV